MLQDPAIKNWLGGIEPAWTLLDVATFMSLQRPPSPSGPIRLAADLTDDEIRQSAVARNTLTLLQAAAETPGFKLTARGNLSRAVVAQMADAFSWPEFDRERAFRLHKVINEPDFLPLLFLRHLAEAAGFLRRQEGHLKITKDGRLLLDKPSALQAILLHVALWHVDLSVLSRGLHHGWPQCDVGIVLWSLSIAARDWHSPERLTRLCTVPNRNVIDATAWDSASAAMQATILRPLCWFGLLEHREEDIPGSRLGQRHFHRKAPLFDRFLSFDVTLERNTAARH
jgi:hypothetical protein